MSQQRPITLADIERGQRLLRNRTAVKILGILGHGEQLPGPLRADQRILADAVDLLNEMGLVEPDPEAAAGSSYQTVSLTPRGRSVVDLLEEISTST